MLLTQIPRQVRTPSHLSRSQVQTENLHEPDMGLPTNVDQLGWRVNVGGIHADAAG